MYHATYILQNILEICFQYLIWFIAHKEWNDNDDLLRRGMSINIYNFDKSISGCWQNEVILLECAFSCQIFQNYYSSLSISTVSLSSKEEPKTNFCQLKFHLGYIFGKNAEQKS